MFSDIEMPQGSGLELLKWVREQKLAVECIYLSSYAHFAYAQKALELHSKAYLLKLVSNKELNSVLDDLISQMKLERGIAGEDRQRVKERYWKNILLGKELDETFAKESKNIAGNYDDNESIVLSLLRIFQGVKHKKIQDAAVFYLTLRHTAEAFMHTKEMSLDVMFQYSDDCFMIVSKNCKKENEEIKRDFRALLCGIEEEIGTSACIYTGEQKDLPIHYTADFASC